MRDKVTAIEELTAQTMFTGLKVTNGNTQDTATSYDDSENLFSLEPPRIEAAIVIETDSVNNDASTQIEALSPSPDRVLDLGSYFREHPLFASAPESFISELARRMHMRHHQPGDVIVQEGETARAMFFLIKGSVSVCSADGERFFAELGAGNFFGEIGVFFQFPRTANVIAKTRCVLSVLTAHDLEHLLEQNPNVADDILVEAVLRYVSLVTSRKLSASAEATAKEREELNSFLQRNVSRIPNFLNVPPAIFEELPQFSEDDLLDIDEGDEITGPLDPGFFVYVIQAGEVHATWKDQVVSNFSPGQFFGEHILLDDVSPVCSYIAGPNCRLFCLTQDHIADLLEVHPQMRLFTERAVKRTYGLVRILERLRRLEPERPSIMVQDESSIPLLPKFASLLDATMSQPGRLMARSMSITVSSVNESTFSSKALSIHSTSESAKSLQQELPGLLTPDMRHGPSDLENFRARRRPSMLSQQSLPKDLEVGANADDKSSLISEVIVEVVPSQEENKSAAEESKLKLPNSAYYLNLEPKRRRASVAVWSDQKLTSIANQKTNALKAPEQQPNKSRFTEERISVQEELSSIDSLASNTDSDKMHIVVGKPLENEPILQRLMYCLELKDAWRLRMVSTAWNRAFLASTSLLHTLDLSAVHKNVDDKLLIAAVSVCGIHLETLILRNCWKISSNGIKDMAKLIPNLEVIDLCGCWEITDESLLSLALSCKKIRSIDLSNCRKISDTGLYNLTTHCTDVRDVFLSYCKTMTDNVFTYFSEHGKNVRRLNFQRCTSITDSAYTFLSAKDFKFFKLQEVVLSDCSFLTDAAIVALSQICPNLRALSLSFCCALTGQSIEALAENCKRLRVLDLSFCGNAACDLTVLLLAERCRDLQRLSLRGCLQISDASIDYLQEHSTGLIALNVSGCRSLTAERLQQVPKHWKLLDAQAPTLEPISITGGEVYNSSHLRRFTA